MTSVTDVLHARLATQRLFDRLAGPAEVVATLAAVQSQEFAHALWSLRLRSASGTEAAFRAAFDRGEFLRTHVLRPTWHLVAAEDIGWLLAVTAPRVQRLNGTMYRQQGLDQAALDRAAATITDALAGGTELTRAELGELLGTQWRPAGLPGDERRAGGPDRQRGDARRAAHLRTAGRPGSGRPRTDRRPGRAGLPLLRRSWSGKRGGSGPVGHPDRAPGSGGHRGGCGPVEQQSRSRESGSG